MKILTDTIIDVTYVNMLCCFLLENSSLTVLMQTVLQLTHGTCILGSNEGLLYGYKRFFSYVDHMLHVKFANPCFIILFK